MAFLLAFCNICLLVGIITVIYGFSQLRFRDLGKQREIAGSANLAVQIYVIFVLIIAALEKRPFDKKTGLVMVMTLYILCATVGSIWLFVLSLIKKWQSSKIKGGAVLTGIFVISAILSLALTIMLGEDLILACVLSTFIYISAGNVMLGYILSLAVVPILCFATLILNIIAIWGKKKEIQE